MTVDFKRNDQYNCWEGTIRAEVVSMSETVLTNKNGKEFVVGTIRYSNGGKPIERSAICYMSNVAKISVGKEYLCNVTITDDQPDSPIISISPLTNAVRATAQDFGFNVETAKAAQHQGAEEVTQ